MIKITEYGMIKYCGSQESDDAMAKRKEIAERLRTSEAVMIDETVPHMHCKNCLTDLGISRLRKKYEHYIKCPNCNYKNYNIFGLQVPRHLYAIINLETGEEISSAVYDGIEEAFFEKWVAEEYLEEHNFSSKSWTIVEE